MLLAESSRIAVRGNVIVFAVALSNNTLTTKVKRVSAVPGDRVDGVMLSAGKYWVVGDNPGASHDSRQTGPIDFEQIVGVGFATHGPEGWARV